MTAGAYNGSCRVTRLRVWPRTHLISGPSTVRPTYKPGYAAV